MLSTPALLAVNDGMRWYNVEVILFAHNNEAALQEEYWPEDPGTPDSSDAISLVTPASDTRYLPGQIIAYEKLPVTMLAGVLARIERSGRYHVIHSTAWRLPGLAAGKAQAVRIRAGRRFTGAGKSATVEAPTHTRKVISRVLEQASRPPDNVLYEVDGRIRVSLSKYLDVDADLLFRDFVFLPDPQGVPTRTLRNFRLTEYRRMKSRTIHYLDHPLFGVIIGIDRY